MSERTDYGAVADRIDYTKLEKKLDGLREQEVPKTRKGVGNVLAPVRGKLAELHAAGWTYARLAEEPEAQDPGHRGGGGRGARALCPETLQSEGELSIASTGKDPHTGRMVTQEYRVEGPVMIFLTTTAVDIDEELLNRCLILTVDESREQTRRIHALQRAGYRPGGDPGGRMRSAAVLALHRAAQRLLRPLRVFNPYRGGADLPRRQDADAARPHEIPPAHRDRGRAAPVPAGNPLNRLRRREDRAVRRRHAGRHRGGEPARARDARPLPRRNAAPDPRPARPYRVRSGGALRREKDGAQRRALHAPPGAGGDGLEQHAASRPPEAARRPGIPPLTHRADQGQGFVYELVYDGAGKDGRPFVCGLLDVEKLRAGHDYGEKRSGVTEPDSGPVRAAFGRSSGAVPGDKNGASPSEKSGLDGQPGQNARPRDSAGHAAA